MFAMRNPKWLGRQQAATILAALLSLLIRKNNPRSRYATFWIRETRVSTNQIFHLSRSNDIFLSICSKFFTKSRY